MSPRPIREAAADAGAWLAVTGGRCLGAAGLASLVACATPAVDVKVPTSSMDEAYRASVGVFAGVPGTATGRMVETTIRPDRPAPIVAAPDIRLAFLYQWVDAEGNLHYPSWVAIPVEAFRWVVPELAPAAGTLPLDGSRSQSAPAESLPRTRHGGPTSR